LTNELTETMCPIADNTPIAPNNAPTSEPNPQACKHTAPRECKAGLPPEVNEVKQERATKTPWDLFLVIAIRLSAIPSTTRDIEARWRSKLSSAEVSRVLGLKPGLLMVLGFRCERRTGDYHEKGAESVHRKQERTW
jgi:hypothetical protein